MLRKDWAEGTGPGCGREDRTEASGAELSPPLFHQERKRKEAGGCRGVCRKRGRSSVCFLDEQRVVSQPGRAWKLKGPKTEVHRGPEGALTGQESAGGLGGL